MTCSHVTTVDCQTGHLTDGSDRPGADDELFDHIWPLVRRRWLPVDKPLRSRHRRPKMRLATSARVKARTETRHTPRQTRGRDRLLPFPARPDAQNFPVRTRRRHCRLNLNTCAKVSGRTVSSALSAAAVPGRDHRPGRRCARHLRQTPPDCRRVRAMSRRMNNASIAVMGTILGGVLAASTALISQTLQAKRRATSETRRCTTPGICRICAGCAHTAGSCRLRHR